MSSNPFFPGKPVLPESFIGRTSEINYAFDQIHNRSHFAIWGGPGMGKSSFLQKLASEETWQEYGLDPSQGIAVILDCQSLTPFTSSGFWREALNLLHNKLDSEPKLQAEIKPLLEKSATNDSLRQALRKLAKKDKFLVLLVDNFDAALIPNDQYTETEMETFLAQCRSLAVHAEESQYLSMIVASLQRLSELGPKLNPNASPWYNHYLFQSLKLFTTKDLVQLLNIIRPPTLRGEIMNITGGHPMLVQTAGFFLYRELQPGSNADIKSFAENFERDTQQIFKTIWHRCNPKEQVLLMLIALLDMEGHIKEIKFKLSGIGRILTQHERSLIKLEEQGVITSNSTEPEKFYSFTSLLMKKWVIQEILQTPEQSIRDREKEFMNLISHGQVNQVKEVVAWLGKNPDQVKSFLDWIVKVVPVFPG
ncbi:ATP-binding protein [Dolichospermum sp. LEGE 00240]|uniref:ATP-binding protein n=1 Tax=Dolichospermum sp. LEGE 00240 TaxID=1828603 RepID=UPI0018808F14|nr:ATP-binding protein [Dolichospermum sp. LEGE 00240]MDM3843503.1 ATP-binding protein [Aphanizomenon gracile PMC638.10]MDM3848912.1 ATP-binding protein [Aphanizomenon gracile PMC627.10]MDM3856299.1 ATP-binding protein [Aphanizomenon gracile PMC649.10]MDM3858475.1 ATP-binding protein [Aphanizomenon gracile PMC644.10]MBE9247766.1 ATP-binding protein [Dolichospermum sp. LEGE 00240]